MTLWELCRILVRYWPVVLIGAVATAGIGLVVISRDGVYFARTTLVFQAPTSAQYPNAIQTQLEAVIDTAGVVAKRVSGPDKVIKFASPEVTLIGLGVRDGWSLRLRDTGGQWGSNFPVQMLTLDVVGPSAQAVQESQQAVIQRARQELNQLQRDAGVDPENDITFVASPASPVIYSVQGNRPRALGMTAVLGISLTVAFVLTLDRRRSRRQRLEESGAAKASDLVAM